MRLRTIWSMPSMTMMERLRRTNDWGFMSVARKLPVRLRYWVTIQEIAHATIKSENIPATTLDEILKELRTPKSLR